MVRGTTPTFSLVIKGDHNLDLTQANKVFVNIRQRDLNIELTGDNLYVEAQVVNCFLPQDESLKLQPGPADIQVNWVYPPASDGIIRRNATIVYEMYVSKQLLERVIS